VLVAEGKQRPISQKPDSNQHSQLVEGSLSRRWDLLTFGITAIS